MSVDEKRFWGEYISKVESKTFDFDPDKCLTEKSKERLILQKRVHDFERKLLETLKSDVFSEFTEVPTDSDHLFYYDEIFPKAIRYLIRDWGMINHDYDQRSITSNYIKRRLLELNITSQESALFLGCGTGRYAVDLSPNYQKVDACDVSLPMIWSIYHLYKLKEWEVLLEQSKNCKTVQDTFDKGIVKMDENQLELIKEKVNFYVADVRNLPLKPASVNHVFSIYFTDVIPFTETFEQVDRILSKGGLFIHFGPLDYTSANKYQTLSTEEIVEFFENRGYSIIANEFFETQNLPWKDSMHRNVYDNWFFIAQKSDELVGVSLHSIIKRNENSLLTKSEFDAKETVYFVDLEGNRFQIPELIFGILTKIEVQHVLKDVLKELKIDSIHEEDRNRLYHILNELWDANVLTIKNS